MIEDQNGCITISAVYSPPKHAIKKEYYSTFFKTLGSLLQKIIMPNTRTGDRDWSYPKSMNCSERLKTWNWRSCQQMNPSTGHLTIKGPLICWTLVLSEAKITAVPSPASNCSDYSPVTFTINSKIINKSRPCILCNTKIKWSYFQELLKIILDNSMPLKTDDDITRAVESFNYIMQ